MIEGQPKAVMKGFVKLMRWQLLSGRVLLSIWSGLAASQPRANCHGFAASGDSRSWDVRTWQQVDDKFRQYECRDRRWRALGMARMPRY
jgi:hypothetical protein